MSADFMTLSPGDVLMLGVSAGAPRVGPGHAVAVDIDGVGRLHVHAGSRRRRMKTARVAYAGAMHEARPHAHGLQLADGRVLAEDQVVWLPPLAEPGTLIALGLNYADHVKELSKELTTTAQDEPLVFLKGPGSLVGHRGHTRARPAPPSCTTNASWRWSSAARRAA
jgi:2-keto-4-pentenoate hydratase/2-oxohepta-3-ene-1,7-dioic acid hydratase in catechol pathway